jgi:hypothetical protein
VSSRRWFAQRCFDEWPRYSAFVRDRRKRLHAALMRHGGPQYWAQELGVLFIVRHPGPRRDEAEIRNSLRLLYREQRFKRFPPSAGYASTARADWPIRLSTPAVRGTGRASSASPAPNPPDGPMN